MTPALKLLLCAPLLLSASYAAASQRPLLATATATPAPALPLRCTGLGCWKNLLFKRESNGQEGYIPPPMINTSMPRVNRTDDQSFIYHSNIIIPALSPTICPSKTQTRGKGSQTWEGACRNTCLRQYMTPVVKIISYYNHTRACKPTTRAVTYSESPRWGDAFGDYIPQKTLFSVAGVNHGLASLPDRCNKTKTSKTSSASKHRRATITVPVTATVRPTYRARGLDAQHSEGYDYLPLADKDLNQEESYTAPLRPSGQERGMPALGTFEPGASFYPSTVDSAPTICLSKRRNRRRQTKKPRKPECTDYPSCLSRCQEMKEKEGLVSGAVILLVLLGVGGLVAILVGRKVYKKVRDRRRRGRREISGESGNTQEPLTEEVVQVVEVEPRPEQRPVKEKKDVDVPTVIVEEPTPTHPRSVDGASNEEIQHADRGRLRITRASGSDVYGSEGSARLRHE